MADERWRALERRWQQTGAVEDEAALIAERLRAGDLAEERGRLLAWLGHEAAVLAVGPAFDERELADASTKRRAQHAFWSGLADFGTEVAARSVLAHARWRRRCINDALKAPGSDPGRTAPAAQLMSWGRVLSQCIDSGVSWVLAPTPDALEVLARDVERADALGHPWWPGSVARDEVVAAFREVAEAVVALSAVAQGRPADLWFGITQFDAGRGAIRAEVVAWALGLRDPLREDVDRRLADVSSIRIASPCHVTWDSMRPIEGDPRVRHCLGCDQPVFDLNRLHLDEAEAIVRAREQGRRMCVRLYRREDGSVLLRDCPVGLDLRVDPPDRDWIG